MKKSIVGLLVAMVSGIAVAGQDPVLMRIDGREVSRSEFEYFYRQKQATGKSQAAQLDFCLDLFIAHKLKAEQSAVRVEASNSEALREKQLAYRRQLIRSYLTGSGAEEERARRLYDRMGPVGRPWKVRIMQLYRKLSQNITSQSLQEIQSQMEAVYETLKSSPSAAFETFVKNNSDDKAISWVGWLQMPAEFEETVFSMKKGEISRPFLSPGGIHIVKVLDQKELPPFEEIRDGLMQQLAGQPRLDETGTFVRKLKEAYGYAPDETGMEELLSKGHTSRLLFTLDGKQYSGAQFELFAAAHPMGIKKQLDAFIAKSVLDYENSRLEEKHPEFRYLLEEHKERLLASVVAGKKAQRITLADSTVLKEYFRKNRSKYDWETTRFKGAVLYCANKKIGKRARKLLKELPPYSWEDAIRLSFNSVSPFIPVHIEQGVFAEGDNEFIDKLVFKKGDTPRTKSYPFTAVLGEKVKGPVYWREVSEQLADDYQNDLDVQLAKRFRASGKVEINEEVLKTVNNH